MSLVLNMAHGFSLLLEGWTLALFLFIMVCAPAIAIMTIKGLLKPAAALALILSDSVVVLVPNTLLATDATWQVMHAAYRVALPDRSADMARDISGIWSSTARSVLVRDWYFTAHRWGVCHELWTESGCSRAPENREAIGIAREVLEEIASTRRIATPTALRSAH